MLNGDMGQGGEGARMRGALSHLSPQFTIHTYTLVYIIPMQFPKILMSSHVFPTSCCSSGFSTLMVTSFWDASCEKFMAAYGSMAATL
jgi:hypothetical protein